MRITEIAQVTVADLMHPSGKWRQEVSLRAAITKGCKQRCTYLTSKKLLAALDAYVAYRLAKGLATTLEPGPYRGLLPHLPMLISRRGGAYSLNTKRRTLLDGERRDYKAADSLQVHVTRLYKRAGIKGGSSHSGRRTMAKSVLEQTGDMLTVALLLGHTSIDDSARYVDVDRQVLRRAFIEVI